MSAATADFHSRSEYFNSLLSAFQQLYYASNRHALLLISRAMDAGGIRWRNQMSHREKSKIHTRNMFRPPDTSVPMNANPLKKGILTENSASIGPATDDMVREREVEPTLMLWHP
ncbi:MAG: hypothetical protein ABI222_16765 [Opitutaceae bacterium]